MQWGATGIEGGYGTLALSHPNAQPGRMMIRTMFRIICTVLAFAFVTALCGCGPYTLRGKVIEGFDNAVLIVPVDDPRLDEPGIREARIQVYRDPERLARELIASDSTASDGAFAIELSAFGAGWMDEQWQIDVSRSGFRNSSEVIRLPSNSNRSRMLIILAPGRATPTQQPDNLWEEYERYR